MTKHLLVAALLAMVPLSAAQAGSNMIGRQSQNEGMQLVPTPANVVIDGDLGEWDLSGRIWVFADSAIRSRYSVEVAGMWDANYVYLAAHWKDPTPMYNTVDPDFNPAEGWKADAWQMRIKSDKNCWITTWYFTPKKMPLMSIADWKNPARDKDGLNEILLRGEPGKPDMGKGVQMVYKADADGKGFVQEVRLPWSVIYRQPPEVKAGNVFRMGMEFLWGDPSGNTWPVHRYADNMQPGQTSREFFWTAVNSWGDMKLVDKGNLPVRQYVDEETKIHGSVPVRVTVPKTAARFTVAINDASGKRIRNLGGDLLMDDYLDASAKPASDGGKTVVVEWDCLDDRGRLVTEGKYNVVALSHDGLGAEYQMCFYNPGTPPWDSRNGTGAWGADHATPCCAAAAGDWMIVSWGFAEGGHGIIGIDPSGQKRWGEKRGATHLAADAQSVYAVANAWQVKGALCRLDARTGAYKPFTDGGKTRPFDLKLSEIFDESAANDVITALAAGEGKLLMALKSGKIAVLDAESAKPGKIIPATNPTALAYGAGAWYAVCDGALQAFDIAAGKLTPVATAGMGKFGSIAVDAQGNIIVADIGPDNQAKAFSKDGKLVYTCGRKGGRPIRGKFDEQAMMHVNSVAVDARGNVWAVEAWDFPRRVSVWAKGDAGKDGTLVRDYIGNTSYAGSGCFLHDSNPELAYVGPLEIKLDLANRTWKLDKILWLPDTEAGEGFKQGTGSSTHP